jgi:hypothetical protein
LIKIIYIFQIKQKIFEKRERLSDEHYNYPSFFDVVGSFEEK